MTGRVADGPRLTRAGDGVPGSAPDEVSDEVPDRGRAGADSDVVFEEASDGDVEGVVALWRTCGLTRPWNDPYRDLADARLGETSTVLVGRATRDLRGAASDDGEPVVTVRAGEVVASAMAGVDGHRGWLYYVAVDPRLRGDGTGRAAVVAAEAWLAAQGARAVRLMVRSTNDAVRGFYERLGYADQECVVLGRPLGAPDARDAGR
ncbi:ribosomal protein S18 acetylase RimI-like enzyme [Cellulosimicrobium cellulans]|uniref:GNAT family acetyltransferase n=1 Tax=Cellulosimicrobium cellulans TaxID=1710 RepID=UPI00195AAE3A|nr:GNAT family acetyltransferase [Cellulosimicrobium cellulans]MBM7819000.1 ribosomal protein S18 acetylase RimI-like enzyme [Cellulosimicrobium cellulans]